MLDERFTPKGYLVERVELSHEIRELFFTVSNLARSNEVYLIGSTVRKLIRKENTYSDFDFIGSYDFDELQKILGDQVISVYDYEEVLKIRVGEHVVDLIQTDSIEDALAERDITLSLLCMNDKGEIFDPLGVYDDLKLELIRILSPREKFEEDPTRILRVLRFSQELGFEIEEHTLAAIHSSNLALSYSHGLASEIEKILQLSPSDRKKIFGLSEDLGLAHLFQQALIVYGENLIQSNPRLENYLAKLQKITGIANTYVFGGTLRDILLKKEFKDMDIKLDESTGALVRKLRQLGFQETDDVELPPNTFYFNERFGAVSIKIEEMIYDFTESGDANEQEWYLNNDINFNSMIFNPVTGKIDNLQLIPEVILGFITLTERYFKRDVTELRIVNYLKQLTRSANLYVSEDDLDYVQKNMGEVLNYFLRYPRMMYKLESLLGNENTDNVLRMIAQSKSGEKLISLLNAYVSEES